MSRPWNVSRLAGIRLVAAFAVVPFVAGIVMFITSVGLWYLGAWVFEGNTPSDLMGAADIAVGLAWGVAIIGFVVTWGGALPAFLSMSARGPMSLRKVLLLGAALGNLPFPVIVVSILVVQLVNGTLSSDVARLWYGLYGTVRAIALGLLIGTSSAAVFWVIGVSGTMRDGSGPSSSP
jgi:hypothetical protein